LVRRDVERAPSSTDSYFRTKEADVARTEPVDDWTPDFDVLDES
jgi:hypothetical protein